MKNYLQQVYRMNAIGRASVQTSKFPGLKLRLTPNQPKPTKKNVKRNLLKNTKRKNNGKKKY